MTIPAAPTFAALLRASIDIDPVTAYSFRSSAEAASFCATPIFTAYTDESGDVIPLALGSGGRYAAGYVRVSTIGQRDDGWSVADQVERIVRYYTTRGMAFRIFSDASLSGKLPTDDADLIRKMYAANAERYDEAYRAVFFADPRYDAGRAEMEAWLAQTLRRIREGHGAEGLVSDDAEEGGVKESRRSSRGRKRHGYRPGLTELIRAVRSKMIHSLALTDLSRLARSQSLSVQIMDDLQHHKVSVIGLVERLDWIGSKSGIGDQIAASVLAIIAEYRLREVCVGAIRGIAQMLSSGKPHGIIPFWLTRSEDGSAIAVASRVYALREMIRLALEEDLGPQAIASSLNSRSAEFPAPQSGEGRGQVTGIWTPWTVSYTLRSPALLGKQEQFGRQWSVLPTIVTAAEWRQIQRWAARRSESAPSAGTGEHLLAYLLKCQCGTGMKWWRHTLKSANGKQYYTCNRLQRAVQTEGEHVRIDANSVDTFFSDLVRYHARILLQQHEATPERDALKVDLARLHALSDDAEASLPALEASAKERAARGLASLGLGVSAEVIAAVAAADPDVARVRATAESLRNEIEERDWKIRSIRPSDIVASAQERAAQWDQMTTPERSDLLRRLIHSIEAVPGKEGAVTLTAYLNTARREPLPPIRLIAERKGRGWSRTAPTVSEWFQSLRHSHPAES